MQSINQIIREISFPVLICLGFALFVITMAIITGIRTQSAEGKSWLSALPIQGISVLLLLTGVIFYCAHDSLKRRKESEQNSAYWKGQLAAIRSVPLIEKEETVRVDERIQSLDGIVGYLEQSIKMKKDPQDITPILLSLAQEIKKIRDGK